MIDERQKNRSSKSYYSEKRSEALNSEIKATESIIAGNVSLKIRQEQGS